MASHRLVAILAMFVIILVFTVGLRQYTESVDKRISAEVAARLDTEAQRRLRDQIAAGEGIWLVRTSTSTPGPPYFHTIRRYLGDDAKERCELDRQAEQADAYRVTVTVGPHYVIYVSECRGAVLRLVDEGRAR